MHAASSHVKRLQHNSYNHLNVRKEKKRVG